MTVPLGTASRDRLPCSLTDSGPCYSSSATCSADAIQSSQRPELHYLFKSTVASRLWPYFRHLYASGGACG